jgi:hypothetical protein
MPKITYKDSEGNSKTIKVENGLTVMEGAIQNDIPGYRCRLWWDQWLALLAMFMSKKNG